MDGNRAHRSRDKNRDKRTHENNSVDPAIHAFTVTSAGGPSTRPNLLKSDIRPKAKSKRNDNTSTREPPSTPLTAKTKTTTTTKSAELAAPAPARTSKSPQNYSSRNSLRSSGLQQLEQETGQECKMFNHDRQSLLL